MDPASDSGRDEPPWDDVLAETISAEIGRIYARIHGRAPTTTRTVWLEEVVVCVLEGVFTADEERLVVGGDFALVRRERLERRGALEPVYRALVETLTGRPVRAYMTEVAAEDVAFEAFVLG